MKEKILSFVAADDQGHVFYTLEGAIQATNFLGFKPKLVVINGDTLNSNDCSIIDNLAGISMN